MRKIDRKYENPFDNIIIDLSEKAMPIFYKLGCTPNTITTFSLITGLKSAYYLYNRKIYLSIAFYLLQYFFDTADGFYARRYKMVTKFGDLYDHAKDIIVHLILLYILIKRYNLLKYPGFLVLIVLLTVCSSIHLGYQEKIYSKDSELSLSFTRKLCIGDPYYMIRYSRFLGTGTIILAFITTILFLNSKTINNSF